MIATASPLMHGVGSRLTEISQALLSVYAKVLRWGSAERVIETLGGGTPLSTSRSATK